jgi:hypothetical protein
MTILDLRQRAQDQLGDQFIRVPLMSVKNGVLYQWKYLSRLWLYRG